MARIIDISVQNNEFPYSLYNSIQVIWYNTRTITIEKEISKKSNKKNKFNNNDTIFLKEIFQLLYIDLEDQQYVRVSPWQISSVSLENFQLSKFPYELNKTNSSSSILIRNNDEKENKNINEI